ncbi:BTAD domain-containing putative transcriptional regulator [Alkaliphilus peptidifermentans]|uniref:Transcriptional activator domain-containing protein n=1 Tax=Alkaliphilus peptidifermentans DSM 18978 TaxID=1120976 RepID=A0A1G5KNH9_9FIRM|nr:BTAD domain-containing putative transcriptional regulator [Alkaliphilus peptidifermentans]SCZ02147.1 transcriptional activator domain-containing protein [Alkaliphilus peptidifermentans DSM 18978]
MSLIPLISTQLVPPVIKNSIDRPGLNKLSLSILSHPITTITAPAGYGKSIWVSSIIDKNNWPVTAWLSLDIHDSEPSFLLFHLIHSIKRIRSDFGGKSLLTLRSIEDINKDWHIIISMIIEEIATDEEMVIVLDDFHLIDTNTTVCSIIDYFIRWVPKQIHLVIISRTAPNLNLYRRKISGDVLEINAAQLLFSIEESWEFLRSLGLLINKKDLLLIDFYTEGWAISLRLMGLLLLKSDYSIVKTIDALKNVSSDLNTYLSKELLEYLPNEIRNFIHDSTLLPYLEPELCSIALQCKNSDVMINTLHSLGLLIKIEGEATTWRLHHLMSECLNPKVHQLRTEDEIQSIRKRAASYLISKGDIERGNAQLVASSDWPQLIKIIKQYGDKYYLQHGRLDSLNSWISYLPETYFNDDHWLLYFKGACTLHSNPQKALDSLSSAVGYAVKNGDMECMIRSKLDHILLRIKLGEEAALLLQEALNALALVKDLPDSLKSYSISITAIIAMESEHLELAIQLVDELIKSSGRDNSCNTKTGVYFLLARIYLLKGNSYLADSYLSKALDLYDEGNWQYFWYWHPETIYVLCRRALVKNMHPNWVIHMLKCWFPQDICKEAVAMLLTNDVDFKNSIKSLIQNIAMKNDTTIIHICCLGTFNVFVNGVEIPPNQWKTKKSQNLFKYLTIFRKSHIKDQVIEALWPESDLKSGDSNIRMALCHIRKALRYAGCTKNIINLRRGMISISNEITIYTDYQLFTDIALDILPEDSCNSVRAIELFEYASSLYRDDLLIENIYDDWFFNLRMRLRQLYLKINTKMINYHLRHSNSFAALEICHKYLTIDPINEDICRITMELLWKSGEKQHAISIYKQLTNILMNQYESSPSIETETLYKQVKGK